MSDESKNRFDRIVAILTQLQTTRVLRAKDLAERFDVSLRTIYRDIRSLEAAGVPVSGEAGSGYSLMEGYRLPPVMFTREEASSFVAADKLMQKFTDPQVRGHYESAMFKLKSVLRGNLKDHIEALEPQVWMSPVNELINENNTHSLEILFESIAEKKQVQLNYQSFDSEVPLLRNIEPVGLFHEDNHWHLMAFCHLRNDYRQFRTDRIHQIRRLEILFTRQHPSIETFRRKEVATGTIKVVIRVDRAIMRYIGSGKKYYGIVSEEFKGDQVELTFMICDGSDSLARWFLMFGDHAGIVEPESFRQQVRNIAESTLQRISGL